MIPPAEMKLIQIEVTNACNHRCCHCSRLIGHHKLPYFMDICDIEKALQTLVDYPGHVGIMGGEPTMHSGFEQICKLLQKYQPVKARRELWTAGWKWDTYKTLIEETFYPELIAYNEHWESQPCWHQPLQIAIEEVIDSGVLRSKIISNCWVQQRWSASITPKGAFFCEVAAARAHMLGYTPGIKVEKGWWKRPLTDFHYQISQLCSKCSACLPMPMKNNDSQEWDDVSPEMYKILSEFSPKYKAGKCKIANLNELREYYKGHTFEPEDDYWKRGGFKDFPDWQPWNYRALEDKSHGPKKK